MQINKSELLEIADLIATSVVSALKKEGIVGKASANSKPSKSIYQKTEALLYNYNSFKRIISEREKDIEELRLYGITHQCGNVQERVQGGTVLKGIVLPEESVEAAVRTVQDSVHETVLVINLIDKCMATLVNDPYYKILEMLYFEGRTQEDMALELGCDQATISRNRTRLVKELSLRMFPNQVIKEMLA